MMNGEPRYEELAHTFGETEFDPEHTSEHERLRVVASHILDCFHWQPTKEDFLFITDTKVRKENPLMIRALEYVLKEREEKARTEEGVSASHKTMIIEASPTSATPFGKEIGDAMRDRPVLICTSMSRSHAQETAAARRGDVRYTQEQMQQLVSLVMPERLNEEGRIPEDMWERLKVLAKERRSRIISITKGHNPFEILTKGAVEESVEALQERADNVDALMRDVRRVHVTTALGTDLWLPLRPDLSEIEDGRVDVPGKISNYPIGEWSCSPDWRGANGVLVVDGPCGGNINQHILDRGEPIRLSIKNGEVVEMHGGGEAGELLRAYLDGGNNEQNHAYKLAEFAVGINTKALQAKPREYWGSSEGEKKYGTCHIAVGSNGVFGRTPDDPNFNAAQVHCDMVLGLNPGGEVTIQCERNDGSTFTLIAHGVPIGY